MLSIEEVKLKTKIMEAKELRIGNYVANGFGICKVDCIFKQQIQVVNDYEEWTSDLDDIKPIPLTDEDWQKVGCVHNILCDVSGFVIFKNGYAYQFIYSDYKNWHQLQNLYFALTGEELEINE